MTHKEEFSSEFDIYLSDILDRLREKYGYADKNRYNNFVRFYYRAYDTPYIITSTICIQIPNSEIDDCMINKTLPKEIQQLL